MPEDTRRLRSACEAVIAGGDLRSILGALDPNVEWYGVDGRPRADGTEAVMKTVSRRRAEGAFPGAELEVMRTAGDRVAVVMRLAPGFGRERKAWVLTLRAGSIVRVEDCATPEDAVARLTE